MSGRTLQPFSFASQNAATNLLRKAIHALSADDAVRARALVDRAARLPYDDHEESAPAAISAHMELFCLVTDTLGALSRGNSPRTARQLAADREDYGADGAGVAN